MKAHEYALNRTKAQIACESRVQKRLFRVAREIVSLASNYRRGATLTNEKEFLVASQRIALGIADGIESDIAVCAKTACSILNVGTESTEAFLVSKVFGKTSMERTSNYLKNFAEDMVRMCKAGVLMKYTDSQLLSAIRTGYKDPYTTSIITKARKEDINIATPSYGKGIFHSAYQNIARNARQMIAVAWGIAEQQYGKESGAIGFTVHRGSSYPCAVCDDETAYVHHFGDPYPPFHLNCRCVVKFIYNEEKDE